MKYIVLWCLIHTVIIPCPHKPNIDEFDRVTNSMIQTLELCWETETTHHSKQFQDRDSAIMFYNKAMTESNYWNSQIPRVASVELDSIVIPLTIKFGSIDSLIIK